MESGNGVNRGLAIGARRRPRFRQAVHAQKEELAPESRVAMRAITRSPHLLIEGTMATRQDRRIVETPTEARQGESGPSVLALLTISLGLAILILAVVWFVFFRT